MTYLDEREGEEADSLAAQIAQFQPRAHRNRDPDLPAVAAEVSKGRGFSRLGPSEQPPDTDQAQNGSSRRGEAPKRKQVSRRARSAQKTDTGQITLTGPFDTLDRLVRRATWDRLTYVSLIERMLNLYEERHGPVPDDFVL